MQPTSAVTYGGVTIPGQQAQPPAGHPDIAFRPACEQVGTVLQANGLVAYTLALPDNTIRILKELEPMDLTQAHLWMDSEGLCKIQGAEVPIIYSDQVPRQATARITASATGAAPPPEVPSSGNNLLLPLLGGGVLLAAIAIGIVTMRKSPSPGQRPIVTPPPANSEQPTATAPDTDLIDQLWGN
jgi:hypothetical protein